MLPLRVRLQSALAIARSSFAEDAVAERAAHSALMDAFAARPLALKAMKVAALLVPLSAGAWLAAVLLGQSIFNFTRGDLFALGTLLFGGGLLVFAARLRPRLIIRAFLALWELSWKALAIYTGILLIPASIFDSVLLGRFFCGLVLLPVVAAAWMMYRQFRSTHSLAMAFPLAFSVMAAVPGFIIPPYYQGIAGWTNPVEVRDTITLDGFQLVNDAGERIWLTHTLFAPVTQQTRFSDTWADKKDKIGPLEPFIMQAYRRAYPLLEKGYMPHQRYLGHLAYPPHTYPTNLPDHRAFPPDRIKIIQKVGITYDRTGRVVHTRVDSDYRVPANDRP